MHTTDELRDALRELADAAPQSAPVPDDPEEALPTAKRARRTSKLVRFGAPVLAAATVAGVVVAGVALTSGTHHATKAATSPKPSRTAAPMAIPPWFTAMVFDVKGLPGATVALGSVDTSSQQRYLSWDGFKTDSNSQAVVRVWAAGRWTPSRPADAQDVTVNGKPGFYGKITSQWMPVGGGKQEGLAWQYAPGAWAAVMRAKTTTKADLLRIADAVRTGQHIPIRVPFRLTGLPAGGRLVQLGCSDGPYQSKGCDLLVDYPARDGEMPLTVDNLKWTDGGTPTTIGGHRVWESRGTIAMAGPGVSEAWITTTRKNGAVTDAVLSKAELRSIMAGLTFAPNVKDPSTWYDATTALP